MGAAKNRWGRHQSTPLTTVLTVCEMTLSFQGQNAQLPAQPILCEAQLSKTIL